MKNKIFFIGMLTVIISACKTPSYLPSSKNINVNRYGSYIIVDDKSEWTTSGELIAINYKKMVILSEDTKKCETILIRDISSFKLKYAKPKHYGWTIPAFLAYPFIHGFLAGATIPIHLIVTISATVLSENSFKYNDKNMTYDKLRMFARFPQGIPANVDTASIK